MLDNADKTDNADIADKADEDSAGIAYQVLDYVKRLHNDRSVPPIPERFAGDDKFLNYHKKFLELRKVLAALSRGDLSIDVTDKGIVAGYCKSMQAALRHLVWKVKQVEFEDYEHQLDFLGELGESFNRMVIKLHKTTTALRQKEEALLELAISLQKEAKKRSEALHELKKSEERFKYLAQHDALTGLQNRRTFFSSAELMLERSALAKKACCVYMIDVDNFKRFNDTYGHLEGDRALQHVTAHGRRVLRKSDIMGRYGGEEFIVFLANIDEAYAYATADRIRSSIERNLFILEDGNSTTITASIGVAIIPPGNKADNHAASLRQAIAKADSMLYKAKAQGRNQICMADFTLEQSQTG